MKNELGALRKIKKDLLDLVAAGPQLQEAAGAGRVFELYIMMRLAKKLHDLGWKVVPLRSDGVALGASDAFVQRGGAPSGLAPAAIAGSTGPSSLVICKARESWEIWNGVQFIGRSGAKHELDLAVVPHDLAKSIRGRGVEGFPFGRPRVAIECKDVGRTGSPDEMRCLVARMYDLTILDSHRFYIGLAVPGLIYEWDDSSKAFGTSPQSHLAANLACKTVLARRSGLSKGAGDMTKLFKISPHTHVRHPSKSATKLVDDVAMWMEKQLG